MLEKVEGVLGMRVATYGRTASRLATSSSAECRAVVPSLMDLWRRRRVSYGPTRKRIRGVATHKEVPVVTFMYVEAIARSSSALRSLRCIATGIGCL